MRLSSSLLKSCIATMAFPSYGYMAEENKALSGLGCAVLVCRLLSHAGRGCVSHVSLFFTRFTFLCSDHDSAVVVEDGGDGDGGSSRAGRKDSRMFAEPFHWRLSFTRMFFEIKQTLKGGRKKKKRHAPESISFHIPSSCDVEEPKMSAKNSEELSFGGLGWDFFLLKKKKKIEKTTTKTPRRISAPGCQRHNAFCPTSCVDVSFWNILVNIQPGTAAVNTNTLFAILCK